jgi:seryl-tRNA synthetase
MFDVDEENQNGGGEGDNQEGTPGKPKPSSHPDTVPYSKYVGVKTMLQNRETELTEAQGKVSSLEEQLSKAVKQEDHDKLKQELDEAKSKLETAENRVVEMQTKSTQEKRDYLVAKGIPEEEVKEMSEDALVAAIKVLERKKPKADLSGGGGGAGELTGSPMELAKRAYSK